VLYLVWSRVAPADGTGKLKVARDKTLPADNA
jgi:hypothetical protein